jgi:hypothetical protein
VEGADAITGNSPIAFVSTEGDVARVTFSNGSFGVTDLDRVGEYTGKADLRPSEDGGDLTVKVWRRTFGSGRSRSYSSASGW